MCSYNVTDKCYCAYGLKFAQFGPAMDSDTSRKLVPRVHAPNKWWIRHNLIDMKQLIVLLCAVMFAGSASLSAQDRSVAPVTTGNLAPEQGRYQDDIRATSAMLKDTRAVVDGQLTSVDKQLTTAAAEERNKLGADHDALIEAQGMLDQMLTLVNGASAEDWEKVKTKAGTVNTMVRETLSTMKK